MKKRSIIIFPEFHDQQKINELREQYDPLVNKISPHITLVFPFESNFTEVKLHGHISTVLADIKPFKITLHQITGGEGRYLFLNVKKGNDQLIELHDKLYSGIMEKFLNRNLTCFPHMTVGMIRNFEIYKSVLEKMKDFTYEFTTLVEKVTVEWIDEDENSRIEFSYPLL